MTSKTAYIQWQWPPYTTAQYQDLLGGHTIKQSPWASPDLCTPLAVARKAERFSAVFYFLVHIMYNRLLHKHISCSHNLSSWFYAILTRCRIQYSFNRRCKCLVLTKNVLKGPIFCKTVWKNAYETSLISCNSEPLCITLTIQQFSCRFQICYLIFFVKSIVIKWSYGQNTFCWNNQLVGQYNNWFEMQLKEFTKNFNPTWKQNVCWKRLIFVKLAPEI